MESQYIKELAEIMKANGVTSLNIEEGHCKVSIERCVPAASVASASPISCSSIEEAGAAVYEQETVSKGEERAWVEIKSPMVGVFYSAKGPGEKNFVSVGDSVKPGDTVCIIEAMKLMNDITAEQAGTVAEICVKNGDIVEFGQTLFKLR